MQVSNGHQVLQQFKPQAAALAFGFDRDIEQVRFIENDLHHAVPHLLFAFKHQPDVIFAQPVEEYPARPGVAEGGVFNFQHGIEVRLGHRAESYSVTH